MSWQVGMVSNAVIAVAYLLIALKIVVPLARSNQLRTNPLGAATAAIFFTCAVHHGTHSVHMLMPTFVADPQGLAMRAAWGWPLAVWDVVGAVVAVYYWSLRRSYSSLMEGAQLFDDFRKREQQALEINDGVLQGLVVAKMALELDDTARANAALSSSIEAASRMITNLIDSTHAKNSHIQLLRGAPAVVDATRSARPATAPDLRRPDLHGETP